MDKNKMYWRTRAIRAETELHALTQSLVRNEIKLGWWERICKWWCK